MPWIMAETLAKEPEHWLLGKKIELEYIFVYQLFLAPLIIFIWTQKQLLLIVLCYGTIIVVIFTILFQKGGLKGTQMPKFHIQSNLY